MTSERQTEIYGSKEKGPTKILNFLYLGSQADALNNDILKKYDIKAILNITIPCIRPDKELIKDSNFLNIELKDNFTEKILPHFERAFEFIDKQKDLKNNVLIHCLAGISRSATFCIAYLMKHLAIDHSCAYSYVKSLRSSISPNFNFLGQLFEYETNLKKVMLLKHEIPKIDIINYSSSSKCANECKNTFITLDNFNIKEIQSNTIINDTTKLQFFKNKNGKRHLQQGTTTNSISQVLRPSILLFDKNSSTLKNELHHASSSTTILGTDKFSPSTEFANISLRTFKLEPLPKIPLTFKEEDEEEKEVDSKLKKFTQDSSSSPILACENPTFKFTTNCIAFHETFNESKRKNYGKNGQKFSIDEFLKKSNKRLRRRLPINDSSKISSNNELPCKKLSLDHSSSTKSFKSSTYFSNKFNHDNIMEDDGKKDKYENRKNYINLPNKINSTQIKQKIPGDVEVKVLIKSKSSANVDKDGEKVNCHVLRKSLTLIFNTDKRETFSMDQNINNNNININNNYDKTPQTPTSRPMYLSISQSHHLHHQQLSPTLQQQTTTSSNKSTTTSNTITSELQTSNHINGRDPDKDSIGSNSSHEITVN
ncbi:Dual specificity phosphatase, catalytic domain and Protein-tyrosine/Dual specificity phosphatase domain and Protein-tyrosine phosphatase, catalytic domain and Dual specificity phosphatase, subgroup, catalytic domain-containing protein [Strongyloides ratti]|uniref:protein-tyrosine-phosphatase n=1 Tax=Strongyloides ratti TaxID=34506 RepID=A0A090KQ85_STRRB|nr:Dual specificity phosphatase, catalytic domain and Protein-tyrosine/Dual specificity phosphatase domain and Protein-tyrosine phosphatase, catalytic domain and Dual specificity phosphatase, subgroup, catalytic domain-containing protein [Strongyloides ratti]CEF59544.1 Dual specificity phosphatase, catalytic domain and Protein-tyrosine/Dual specificity phosphatase domain and Protein-tyrosine phosphatase, catalytic domain and Dual specificity phosphatase, subgroup, catalytic domain-containing prote